MAKHKNSKEEIVLKVVSAYLKAACATLDLEKRKQLNEAMQAELYSVLTKEVILN